MGHCLVTRSTVSTATSGFVDSFLPGLSIWQLTKTINTIMIKGLFFILIVFLLHIYLGSNFLKPCLFYVKIISGNNLLFLRYSKFFQGINMFKLIYHALPVFFINDFPCSFCMFHLLCFGLILLVSSSQTVICINQLYINLFLHFLFFQFSLLKANACFLQF